MRKKYAIAYCDGYYITENGRGILDLAHTQDQEFAIFVRDALNAAEQSVQPTGGSRRARSDRYASEQERKQNKNKELRSCSTNINSRTRRSS